MNYQKTPTVLKKISVVICCLLLVPILFAQPIKSKAKLIREFFIPESISYTRLNLIKLDDKNVYALNFDGDNLINYRLPTSLRNLPPIVKAPDNEKRKVLSVGSLTLSKDVQHTLVEQAINMANVHQANTVTINKNIIILGENLTAQTKPLKKIKSQLRHPASSQPINGKISTITAYGSLQNGYETQIG